MDVGQTQPLNFTPIFRTDAYAISREGVKQGKFTATALSATEIVSNYQSPVKNLLPAQIYFKFGLNGHDNEMPYGQNHFIQGIANQGLIETPLIKFGEQFIDQRPVKGSAFLLPNTPFKIRLDLRHVFKAFATEGWFLTHTGEKVYEENFEGVYVAGSANPLNWNFPQLADYPGLKLKEQSEKGIYEILLTLNPQPADSPTAGSTHWTLTKNISAFPQFLSEFPLLNALYNLGLEELVQAIEPDNTFRTGKEWAGVWTRDISYSIILALAAVEPEVSAHSLLQKVKNGCIVQDTGTGGAYPVSTDRQIWTVAAWEIYLVTGSLDWLRQAYTIICTSLAIDYQHLYDSQTGLVRGESSFLDWREQTYPAWMQPADIYESECLSTNAVHYQANKVVAQMAYLLKDSEAEIFYRSQAEKIKKGINKYLWQPSQGYYGQYLYGRHYKILSPRADALGEALCILFDIADVSRQKEIMINTPVGPFGISCIYPQIPEIPPYHNKAVWPFVQAYWSLAAAQTGNEASLTESICAFYRPAALFLTYKENFVSATGDFGGTQINSDNMLWSLAGNLSTLYKIFFGLHFTPDGLVFKPFVPKAFAGKYKLLKFTYRRAQLNIYLEGSGCNLELITLNGQALPNATLPPSLQGEQEIRIKLTQNQLPAGNHNKFNKVEEKSSPETPTVTLEAGKLTWPPVNQAVNYYIFKNGVKIRTSPGIFYQLSPNDYGEFQVIAVAANGFESFASEPLIIPEHKPLIYKVSRLNEQGYVEISKKINRMLQVPVTIPEAGTYAIDVQYANGNGLVESENKCAFRALLQGNIQVGILVMPQRGVQAWSDWGYSNAIITELTKGPTQFTLAYLPSTENMHPEINEARIKHFRFLRLS